MDIVIGTCLASTGLASTGRGRGGYSYTVREARWRETGVTDQVGRTRGTGLTCTCIHCAGSTSSHTARNDSAARGGTIGSSDTRLKDTVRTVEVVSGKRSSFTGSTDSVVSDTGHAIGIGADIHVGST